MTTVTSVWDATTLLTCCQRVLTAITDVAAVLPDAVALPDREITSTAGVTWDCPMVYVSALSVQTGIPDPDALDLHHGGNFTFPQGNIEMWSVTVEAGVVRPVIAQPTVVGPAESSPDPDDYTADLTNVSSDTAVLMNAALTLGARNLQPVPNSANMLASQGGFHGVAATFTVEAFPGPPLP